MADTLAHAAAAVGLGPMQGNEHEHEQEQELKHENEDEQRGQNVESGAVGGNNLDVSVGDAGEGADDEYTAEEVEVAEEYNDGLDNLKENNRQVIVELTEIARENESAARAIADTVVASVHMRPRVEQKMPLLYLMDSIVKNVGGAFKQRFEAYVQDVFLDTYKSTRESSQRKKMMHLLDTWDGVFASSVVQSIRDAVMQWAQEQQKVHVETKQREHAAKRERLAAVGGGGGAPPAAAAAGGASLAEISAGIAQVRHAMTQPGLLPQQLQEYAATLNVLTQAFTSAQQVQSQAALLVPTGAPAGPGLPGPDTLLARLAAQGMLIPQGAPTANFQQQLHPQPQPPHQPQTAPAQEPEISWDDVSPAALRTPRPSVIKALQSSAYPYQCKSCALRFASEVDMGAHMDWHFKCNKRRKALAESQRPVFRPWYMTLDEIISTKGGSIDVGAEAASEHSFFALQATQKRTQAGADGSSVAGSSVESRSAAASAAAASSVPADDEQESCLVCGERFEEYWDTKLDEWMYRGTRYLADGKTIVHVQCYTAVPGASSEPPSKKYKPS